MRSAQHAGSRVRSGQVQGANFKVYEEREGDGDGDTASRNERPEAHLVWSPSTNASTLVRPSWRRDSLAVTLSQNVAVVPPRGPTPHIHRYNRITLILILCIGFACVRADSGKLPPREGEKTSKRNS